MGSVIKANVLSLFVRQQGGTFIAVNNKEDLAVPEGAHRGWEGHSSHRQNLPAE